MSTNGSGDADGQPSAPPSYDSIYPSRTRSGRSYRQDYGPQSAGGAPFSVGVSSAPSWWPQSATEQRPPPFNPDARPLSVGAQSLPGHLPQKPVKPAQPSVPDWLSQAFEKRREAEQCMSAGNVKASVTLLRECRQLLDKSLRKYTPAPADGAAFARAAPVNAETLQLAQLLKADVDKVYALSRMEQKAINFELQGREEVERYHWTNAYQHYTNAGQTYLNAANMYSKSNQSKSNVLRRKAEAMVKEANRIQTAIRRKGP